MKKKISVARALVLVLFAVLLTFQITYSYVGKEYQAKVDTLTKTQSDFSKLAQADELIRENFYGAIKEDQLENGLIKGYISSLDDPYSAYLTPEEYTRYQKEEAHAGSGIGARFTYNSKTEEVVVYAVYPASPAENAGLKKGDVIVQIDEENVSDLGFYDAVSALSGDSGTKVNVHAKRRLAAQTLEMDFTITRQEIQEPTVAYEMLRQNVGYVQIYDIHSKTVDEFKTAVETLIAAKAEGIVFDIRNNSGTDVTAVCQILDYLLPKGVILRTFDQKGNESRVKSDESHIDLPMSVITNSATACAAEIFAATLKDFSAATLVGETTYGKGLTQAVVEMDDGSALILSNMTFSPPKSPSFEDVGVIPEIECKLKEENLYLVSHDNDNQLDEAIAVLGI